MPYRGEESSTSHSTFNTLLIIIIKTCWDTENESHPEDWCQ